MERSYPRTNRGKTTPSSSDHPRRAALRKLHVSDFVHDSLRRYDANSLASIANFSVMQEKYLDFSLVEKL